MWNRRATTLIKRKSSLKGAEKINHNNFIMEKEKCQVEKNYVKTFKLNLLLAELESCFGRISTPMSVMLDRVTERELDFYIDKIVKKGGDANVR
jgi:hypothetical protein